MRRGMREMAPIEVQAFFDVRQSSPILDTKGYVGENEIRWRRGRQVVEVTVVYEEGCPTCGGAYVKRWLTWEEA